MFALASRRLRRTDGEEDPPTLRWDDGPPWQFGLDVRPDPGGKRWSWRGSLHRPRSTAWMDVRWTARCKVV